MKIAFSSSGKDLDAILDPRFGRCAYFLIVDTDDMSFEAFENKNAMLSGGAGIQSAQFIATRQAEALVTGYCGPNAVKTLKAAGIILYADQAGKISDLVESCKTGKLIPATEANAPQHSGTGEQGAGQGMRGGRGMGGGRRMGGGGSMGGGRGMGGDRRLGGGRGMGAAGSRRGSI